MDISLTDIAGIAGGAALFFAAVDWPTKAVGGHEALLSTTPNGGARTQLNVVYLQSGLTWLAAGVVLYVVTKKVWVLIATVLLASFGIMSAEIIYRFDPALVAKG